MPEGKSGDFVTTITTKRKNEKKEMKTTNAGKLKSTWKEVPVSSSKRPGWHDRKRGTLQTAKTESAAMDRPNTFTRTALEGMAVI